MKKLPRVPENFGMLGLVGIKRVIDYTVRVRIRSDGKGVETQNVKMSVNPFCEIAVEEALRMKSRGLLSEVVTVSVGPEKAAESLRQTLAMGADRSVHVLSDDNLSPLFVAQILKKVAESQKAGLILLGKQSIDGDNNQTGQILAGMLGWPQATFASEIIETDDKSHLQVKREVDTGIQTIKVPLPCVITADLRLNEPRFATLPNLMKAKKKPIEVLDIKSLGIDLTPRVEVIKLEDPPKRKAGVKVASVDELIQKLRFEAKVI